jgi:hypothetical protein
MSFVPKDITTLSTVLSNTLDLASFIVSSIFSNVAPEIEAFTILPRKGKGPNITKCNDTVLNVNIFLKKLCIREQIECVDAYELFTKQGNVLKSLFDYTDSSGVHISVSNTLDLASFIVSSIFSNVAPEIEAFMQFWETFPSLLQLEAPSKGDHDQVNINLTHAIHQVKCNFPNSVVGICTILPRIGKGPTITKCNDTVLNVNIFLKKLAFMQFWETFPSLLQLEAPSKTFTELLSSVVGLLSACPDVSLRSVSSSKLELSRVFLPSMIS